MRPLVDNAKLRLQPEDAPQIWCDQPISPPPRRTFEFSTDCWEIIKHDKPTENLQKLLDLGYKEGAACRILDTLGLD